MIIAITGHTSGIGQAVAAHFSATGHTVLGFSRNTGHNLAEPDTIVRIAEAAYEADVLVNNAFYGYAQVDLLYAMYDVWRDNPTKTIVNVSSNSSDGIKRYRHPYAVQKAALDKAVEQLQTIATCRILSIRPGYVDTPMVKHVTEPKLTPQYVAGIIGWMIDQRDHVRILTVTP